MTLRAARAGTVTRVFLIGMMGAGKTTVGSALASRLGWSYLDSDAEIERRRGLTVPEIWRSEGEPAFRAEESAVLAAAAGYASPVVVAVAGGALLEETNRATVRSAGTVVWLRAPLSVLAERVGSGVGRPLLSGPDGVPGALAQLCTQREPVYSATADLTIDVAGRLPGEVVGAIVTALSLDIPATGGVADA